MSTQGTALREGIAEAIALLAEPVSLLAPGRLSGDEYVSLVREMADLSRIVSGAEVALAGEAANRAAGPIDTLGALGYANAVDAVAILTSASDRESKQRIRLGTALNSGASLTGAETGSAHPHVAAAVAAGNLGPEAAWIIVEGFDKVSSRVDPALVLEAEEAVVRLAEGTPDAPPLRADLVRDQVAAFVAAIDPDGVLPREEFGHRQRRLVIGRETRDGLIPVHGLLTVEIGETFRRLTDAHMRKPTFTEDGYIDPVIDSDQRTPGQKRHDSFADVLSAAVRVKDAPELAGGAPAITVIVSQTVLEEGRGVGVIDGISTPISVEQIDRLADSRGFQPVTIEKGRTLALGSAQRCFTGNQRRAITARDGGCVIPGCTTPAGWCEVHHVIPWREGGETHTDNGVLLCWGHHRIIDSGPWQLSMPDGVPHVRGPGHRQWTHTTKSRIRPPDVPGAPPPDNRY